MKQRNLISARERSAQYAVDIRGGIPSPFSPHHMSRGILVPWPGIEPAPSTVKVPSPNCLTAREFPGIPFWMLPPCLAAEYSLVCPGRLDRAPGYKCFLNRRSRKYKNIESMADLGKYEKIICFFFCNPSPIRSFSSDPQMLWVMRNRTVSLRYGLETLTEILRLDPGHWNVRENSNWNKFILFSRLPWWLRR